MIGSFLCHDLKESVRVMQPHKRALHADVLNRKNKGAVFTY